MVTGADRWPEAVTVYQHLTGLGLQWGYDDGAGVASAVLLQAPLSVQGVGAAVPSPLLHRVGAGVAGGVGVGRVVDCDTADDILPLLGDRAGGGVFLLFLLIRVAADGDDTDGGAGGVRDDNRLSLSLPRGAGGHVTPPTGD